MSVQRGFGLVEALVALLVLSLGLIGVAAVQLKALQGAQNGYRQTLSSVAVLDAQERLWAAYRAAPACADMALGRIERDWRQHWFAEPAAVLRGNAAGAIDREGCTFSITVSHAASENATYRLTLPGRAP